MRSPSLVLLLLLACLLTALVACPASAQDDGVAMSIAFAKPEFVIGEPVDLIISYTNTGSGPIEFLPHCDTDWWYFLAINVTEPDGTQTAFGPTMHADLNPMGGNTRGVVIAPGATCRDVIPITVGVVSVPWLGETRKAIDFVFDRPGAYAVQACYANELHFFHPIWRGRATSSPVSLRIVAPEGAEKEATEAWRVNAVKDYLAYVGTTQGPKQIAAFSAFLREHPTSVLADYARYYLAQCYARINPHQPADAIPLYRQVLQRGKPEYHLPQARLGLADCYRQLGDTEAARQTLAELIALEPKETTSTTQAAAKQLLASPDGKEPAPHRVTVASP